MAKENVAARRWVPWLCAYTGARVNEITQMRSRDVMIVDGLHCVRITPEAGTVKDAKERIVPLHPHLIELGFVKFVRSRPKSAPLFYSLQRQRRSDRENPTYASVGNKLAEWVRNLGIADPRVAPIMDGVIALRRLAAAPRWTASSFMSFKGTPSRQSATTTVRSNLRLCIPRSSSIRGTTSWRPTRLTGDVGGWHPIVSMGKPNLSSPSICVADRPAENALCNRV